MQNDFPKIPKYFKWSGYISFFVAWYLLGYLLLVLIGEILFREFLSTFTHVVNLIFCAFFFSVHRFNSKFADLRNARRENEYWRKVIKLIEEHQKSS